MRAVRPIKTPNRTQLMLCDMAEDLSVYLLVCDPVWVGLIKQQFRPMSEINIKSIDGLVNSNKSMRAETDV